MSQSFERATPVPSKWGRRRADDRWFVVSLTLNNPTKDTGVMSAICLGADAISLLAVAP